MISSLFDTIVAREIPVIEEKAKQQEFEILVNDESVPVKILFEERFNNRATVNKNGILIRVSSRQQKDEQRKHIDTLLKWAKKKLGDKPALLESLQQRQYVNGEILKVGAHEFVISIFYNDLSKSSAKIFRNNILLSLAKGLNKEAESNAVSYLISKCLCKFYQPVVIERLHELNNRYFKKNIQGIKMKYASSFWGHCSYNGHIVISLRLMFAPHRTIDYVLIHELAHLVHHNHSQRFWKLVEQVMPDYRNHEKHLSENNLKYYL